MRTHKYSINSSIRLKWEKIVTRRDRGCPLSFGGMQHRAHVSSGLNTDNDSSVTVEPHRVDASWVEPSREADRVGGSGNGSNHGRIRLELSRRRIIIVSWHRSVVPFPAHRFSFLDASLSLPRFFRRDKTGWSPCKAPLAAHFQNLDTGRVLTLAWRKGL